MRPTQAKEHHAVAPPPVPRPVPLSGSPVRVRPDGATGEARGSIPPDPGDARVVDADVPAAVGRVLDLFLADRVARARAMDVLFAEELAGRVVRFTRTGGKRARSQLLWWSLRACGGAGEPLVGAALRIGAALELLQTCALVHDDVMDGSARRRGRPALHAELSAQYTGAASPRRVSRFGEAAGLLAGDLALAWSDDLVAETPLDPVRASAVRRLWSDMRTEMVAGQYLDVQGQITGAYSLSRALRAACLKSARYSVERPLALGAALADADDATTRALRSAGRCAGMAFQLRDDLDDVFGDPRRTGKPCGGDIREGKPTYLVALARVRAETTGDHSSLSVLRRSLGDAGLAGPDLDRVREVLTGTGARATVEARIGRLIAQGLHHLDDARLEHEPGTRLRHLLATAADSPRPTGGGPPPPGADGGSASGDGGPVSADGGPVSADGGPVSADGGPPRPSAGDGPVCAGGGPEPVRPGGCGPRPGDGAGVSVSALLAGSGAKECGR
ncbi:polyprenyl synthetase family protein [Streptomyces dangxiongensis]|uniref:polyprenyl synthetase family protein n=1 Tax=Streptomyces dangxiongensis TaxID=1442032 RepID=UPI0013CE7A0F|nr:polyprenyl synthetase family protein [Streptomyces dangxiongensis]